MSPSRLPPLQREFVPRALHWLSELTLCQCPACHLSFCQPHFLPSHHSCTSPLPKSMQDRIAPQCPLCNSVVNSTPTGDPNEAVDRHINSGTCTGLEGGEARRKAVLRQKKDKGEVCWRKGCAKTIVVQIKCDVSSLPAPSRPARQSDLPVLQSRILSNPPHDSSSQLFEHLHSKFLSWDDTSTTGQSRTDIQEPLVPPHFKASICTTFEAGLRIFAVCPFFR